MRELEPLSEQLAAKKRELAEKRGRQTSFKLGIVGVGNLGRAIAMRLAGLGAIEGYLEIPEVQLYTRNLEKAKELANSLRPAHGRRFVVAPALESIVAETHIAIIAAESDGAKAYRVGLAGRPADREELCARNLDLIKELGLAFRGYRGVVAIATNDPVALAGFFCSTALLEPGQVFGITHVDSLRAAFVAADWIRRELGFQIDRGELEILVAGGHDAGTMVPLLSEARFGRLPTAALGLLHEKLPSLKAEVEAVGPKRYLALGDTAIDTSDAIIDSIEAVVSENKRVSAAIYCDFDSGYFKADPDFFSFDVPKASLWLGLPTRFRNLRAYPDIDFKELDTSEKEAFYGAAHRYAKLAEKLGRSKIVMAREERAGQSKPELMLYVTAGHRLLEIDKSGQACRSWKFDEPLRRFGSTTQGGEERYIGAANGFWLIREGMVRYTLGRAQPGERYGVNSVVRIGDRLFATDHSHGLLCSRGLRLEVLVDCAARELLPLWNGVAFAASYGKENAVLHYDVAPRELFLADSELVGLARCNELILAVSKSGSLYALEPRGRELKVVRTTKLPGRLFSLAADNESIVLGGERAVYWLEPGFGSLHAVKMQRPVLDLALFAGIAIATDGSALYNAFNGMKFADYENIKSVCLSSKI